MTNFRIDVVTDTVCPFCYLGKKKLEQGIAAYKEAHSDSDDTFEIDYHPFYLNKDTPHMNKREYYKMRFGDDPSRPYMMENRVSELGKAVGINFSYDGMTGPSRDSHRLVQLGKAKSSKLQTRVIEELYRAYFEQAEDIADRKTLVDIAGRAGLDRQEAEEWLEKDGGGPQVDREAAQAVAERISGVPNFTIQDKFRVSGAQDPAVFAQIFERAKAL